MTRPSQPKTTGENDPEAALAYMEQQAAYFERLSKEAAQTATQIRGTMAVIHRRNTGQAQTLTEFPTTGPLRYAGKKDLSDYVVMFLVRHGKAVTREALAGEMEDGGAFLETEPKALNYSLAVWSGKKRRRGNGKPKFKIVGEKVGLIDWDDSRF